MFRFNPFVRVGAFVYFTVTLAGRLPRQRMMGEPWSLPRAIGTKSGERCASSISVITQQDLQRRPVQNAEDVLKEVPGVQLTNEGDNRKAGVSI